MVLPVYRGLKPEKNYIAGRARAAEILKDLGYEAHTFIENGRTRAHLGRRECGSRHSIQGAGIILVHNHPSAEAKPLGVAVQDRVVSRDGVGSSAGWLCTTPSLRLIILKKEKNVMFR